MTHFLACAICCSVLLVFSFSSLLNLGSKTRSCTQQSAGFSPTPPFQRGVPCISGEPVSVALLNCENLSLVDCQTCCALSMPAVGHALLCLLLAMLFFACCWPCSSLPAVGHALLTSTLRIGLRVSSAPVACCHATALLFVSFVYIFGRSSRLQCQLFVPVVPLVVLFSLRVSSALVFCLPEFDPLGSVVQVTVVLRHRAVLDNLTLPLSVFFSITGSSGCDSFSVLSSSDVASCERRVPRAPLCGSLQQRGPLSLRKFSLSGLGTALPRCGLGPPT